MAGGHRSGLSSKPDGAYSAELLAADIAAFMQAAGVDQAHIAGLSLGAATGMWLAARYPARGEVAVAAQRLAMPPVDAFLRQSEAVLAHDARDALGSIQAPTLITFGARDLVTSTRFAGPLTAGIPGSELVVFEDCAHAPIYQNVPEFNRRTLEFLQRHSSGGQQAQRWRSCPAAAVAHRRGNRRGAGT